MAAVNDTRKGRGRWVALGAACLSLSLACLVAVAAALPIGAAGATAGAAGSSPCAKKTGKGGSTKKVLLDDTNLFTPDRVAIKQGGKVKFVWNGVQTHDVTLTKGKLGPGGTRTPLFSNTCTLPIPMASGTFTRRFIKAGTFHFECTIHQPQMDVTVVVKAKRKHR